MLGVWISAVFLLGVGFVLFCVVNASTPYDSCIDDIEQEKFLKKGKS